MEPIEPQVCFGHDARPFMNFGLESVAQQLDEGARICPAEVIVRSISKLGYPTDLSIFPDANIAAAFTNLRRVYELYDGGYTTQQALRKATFDYAKAVWLDNDIRVYVADQYRAICEMNKDGALYGDLLEAALATIPDDYAEKGVVVSPMALIVLSDIPCRISRVMSDSHRADSLKGIAIGESRVIELAGDLYVVTPLAHAQDTSSWRSATSLTSEYAKFFDKIKLHENAETPKLSRAAAADLMDVFAYTHLDDTITLSEAMHELSDICVAPFQVPRLPEPMDRAWPSRTLLNAFLPYTPTARSVGRMIRDILSSDTVGTEDLYRFVHHPGVQYSVRAYAARVVDISGNMLSSDVRILLETLHDLLTDQSQNEVQPKKPAASPKAKNKSKAKVETPTLSIDTIKNAAVRVFAARMLQVKGEVRHVPGANLWVPETGTSLHIHEGVVVREKATSGSDGRIHLAYVSGADKEIITLVDLGGAFSNAELLWDFGRPLSK